MKTISQERRAGHVETAPVPAIKRRRGRPSEYEPWMLQEAALMAARGATVEEICATLEIHRATFYEWKHSRPDFADAIERSKAQADERVVHTLYARALGGVKRKIVYDAEGKVEQTTVEELPGDTRAGLAWLYARGVWKAPRQEHEIIVPETATPPEQHDVRKLALAAIALIREAPDAPLIDATPIASYDTQEEGGFDEEIEGGIDVDL